MNKEINARSKQLSEKISESIHVTDHDPSMALYRLQEHIHKVAPNLTSRKYVNYRLNATIQNACCDLDSANKTLEQMKNTSNTFSRVHDLLKNCNFYKQQLDYEENRTS